MVILPNATPPVVFTNATPRFISNNTEASLELLDVQLGVIAVTVSAMVPVPSGLTVYVPVIVNWQTFPSLLSVTLPVTLPLPSLLSSPTASSGKLLRRVFPVSLIAKFPLNDGNPNVGVAVGVEVAVGVGVAVGVAVGV